VSMSRAEYKGRECSLFEKHFRLISDVLEKGKFFAVGIIIWCMLQLAVWALENSPSFVRLGLANTPVGVAGSAVTVKIAVSRDLSSDCTVDQYLYLQGANGQRASLPRDYFNSNILTDLERTSPGVDMIRVEVPAWMPVGLATLHIDEVFKCNPWQHLRPLEVKSAYPVVIM